MIERNEKTVTLGDQSVGSTEEIGLQEASSQLPDWVIKTAALFDALGVTPQDGNLNPDPEFLRITGASIEEYQEMVAEDNIQNSPQPAA